MSTQAITEYNQKALKNINEHLDFSDWEKEPIQQIITYCDFTDKVIRLKVILDAIEFIGFNGGKEDLATCAGLAQIANQITPTKEMYFLDELLTKKENGEGKKIDFTPLNK